MKAKVNAMVPVLVGITIKEGYETVLVSRANELRERNRLFQRRAIAQFTSKVRGAKIPKKLGSSNYTYEAQIRPVAEVGCVLPVEESGWKTADAHFNAEVASGTRTRSIESLNEDFTASGGHISEPKTQSLLDSKFWPTR
ncbi:hypothetical protein L916_18785 [Phytophthora nicotianae]|uniref:Uncharacterized protein n=1 Tax=Phytophthora nicotianae TaxID=4792 RepID=W2I2L9_PHYNI|nr:hypothetical protein L916_18785 [Phytophthora nicotianae]